MAPTRRKFGGKKKKSTIKYTWGIHSLTRKRMKTHRKKKRSHKRNKSRRRRKSRGRRRKGGDEPKQKKRRLNVNTADHDPATTTGPAPDNAPAVLGEMQHQQGQEDPVEKRDDDGDVVMKEI